MNRESVRVDYRFLRLVTAFPPPAKNHEFVITYKRRRVTLTTFKKII